MRNAARELRLEAIACDAVELAVRLGIGHPMKRQPGGVIVRCPSHEERDPSCSLTLGPDGTLRARCFACGWTGDALDLVAKVLAVDFPGALLELARFAARWDIVDELEGRKPRAMPPRPVRPPPPTAPVAPSISDARFDEIASALLECCPLEPHSAVKRPRQADVIAYVTEKRGIFADAQAVGFGALPPPRKQAAVIAELRAAFGGEDIALSGLVRGDRFAYEEHRLVIPWRDRAGRIVTLQRRVIRGAPKSKYIFPKGRAPRVPFGVDLFDVAVDFHSRDVELVVCEGALDTLARRRIARLRGESCVVVGVASATLRFDGWSELVAGRDVVLAFDADAAGDKAVTALAPLCSRAKSLTRERAVGANDLNEVLLALLGAA